jgi:FkbM family methyltransferase
MSFISYAQNFEDVMLWRALKHIKNGVYVDIGAQHPLVDSVSKAFYEQGWRGIHIEPVPQYVELLRQDRPDEMVLQVALADVEGTLELNVIPDTGLSTAIDTYAQRHQTEHGFQANRIQVPVLTLKSALRSLIGKEVHWLKIDVEGFEEQVLRGWNSEILRPWVMVIEATIPNSSEQDYASWDPILAAADYQFVYFDGLNRFYVANEHSELIGAFYAPPNVFDAARLSGLASSELCRGLIENNRIAEQELVVKINQLHKEYALVKQQLQAEQELVIKINQLQKEYVSTHQQLQIALDVTFRKNLDFQVKTEALQNALDTANLRVTELNQSSHHWWCVANNLEQELLNVYASKSWRITWILRKTVYTIKQIFKPILIGIANYVIRNAVFKRWTLNLLNKRPRWKHHLRLFAINAKIISDASATAEFSGSNALHSVSSLMSPRSLDFYAQLKSAVQKRGI